MHDSLLGISRQQLARLIRHISHVVAFQTNTALSIVDNKHPRGTKSQEETLSKSREYTTVETMTAKVTTLRDKMPR